MKTNFFFIQHRNRFLNGNDAFEAPTALGKDHGAVSFPSEAAAIAKAESLPGIDLDRVKIVRIARKAEPA